MKLHLWMKNPELFCS